MVRARSQGWVVELCGLPGAGKSTFAEALVRELTCEEYGVRTGPAAIAPEAAAPRRLAAKGALTLREALAHPACTRTAVAALARSKQWQAADFPARAVQWTITQRVLRAARSKPLLHVVDEGVVQALWSVGLRGDVDPVLHALQRTAGWVGPDLVVVVDAPLDVIRGRLAARRSRHSRTQALDPPAQLLELVRGMRQLERVVSWWADNHGPQSIARIRDHRDVASLVTHVGETLR